MSSDCYKVDIVYFLNPHLVWIERNNNSLEQTDDFSIEQVGLYGLLPVDVTIGAYKLSLTKSDDWILAAAALSRELISRSTEIWFTATHVDRRVSIFDSNIQKYGDFKIKINNEYKSLSEELIGSGFAYLDICVFHQKLSSGDIKTRLSHLQTNQVIKEFLKYYIVKGFTKDAFYKVLNKQMSVFLCSQEIESTLTESHIKKHNNSKLKNILENKMKDMDMCKDVDEQSVGRASKKSGHTVKRNESSTVLMKRLSYEHHNKMKQHLVKTNNAYTKNYLEENSPELDITKKTVQSDILLDEKNIEEHSNGCSKAKEKSSVLLQRLNAMNKKARTSDPKNIFSDSILNVEQDKLKIENNAKNCNIQQPECQQTYILGPQGINLTKCKKNVVQLDKDDKFGNNKMVLVTDIEDVLPQLNIGVTDTEIEFNIQSTINNKISDLVSVTGNVEENKNSHKSLSSSSSNVRESLKFSKRILQDPSVQVSPSVSSAAAKDITNEHDTSVSNESDIVDTDIENLTDHQSQDRIKTYTKEILGHKMKTYVNPFRNIDSNMSIFVDKLVTPILMVHSKFNRRIEPIHNISDVNFNKHIHNSIQNLSMRHPMMLQSISWCTILRNYSLFLIGPMYSGKTIGYLAPVCRLVSDNSGNQNDGLGPIAIIVCATAQSIASVERVAKMFLGPQESLVTCYAGVDELEVTTRLLNGCDLLICTPPALVRLLKAPEIGVDLRRLSTFVLDDCERHAAVYNDEIKFTFHKINEMLKRRANKEWKVQFILASRIWCDFMTPLVKKVPDTVICMSAFQECVIYSKANVSVNFMKGESKINYVGEFLKGLDKSKKTVIVCRCDEEINMLSKALKKPDTIILECDSTMTVQDLYNINISWADYDDPLVGPILLCCDGNLTHMNVTDAHYLVHYSMPPLFSMFCKRFSVLNDHYPSIFKEHREDIRVKILLEETNIEQLPKIINFIKRCTDSVPSILNKIAEKVSYEKDYLKAKNLVPICNNLLSFGHCPDPYNCRDRHTMFKEYDAPKEWLPKSGEVIFKLLNFITPVCYSARLISHTLNDVTTKYKQTYNSLATKIAMYYSKESNRRLLGVPKVGDYCAFLLKPDFFVRCQVVKIINYYKNETPNNVLVNLIDEEKLEITRDVFLYHLPDDIKIIKTCTAQVRLANVMPKDKDITFSKLALSHLKDILGTDEEFYLKGNISLVIGNFIYVNNLEACQDLKSINQIVTHYNLRRELLERHAIINVAHITNLKKLCLDSDIQTESQIVARSSTDKKTILKDNWAHFGTDDMPRVLFASALSPEKFFVRLDKFESCITNLLQDIQKYVQTNKETLADVTKGDFALAQFPDDLMYERVRIEEIQGDKIKCFFVDQGDWREVSLHNMTPIPDVFINKLPFQAIECRLIGIKPLGEQWTDFSTNWLCDNCFEDASGNVKKLYVKQFIKEPAEFTDGYKYGVALVDTNSSQDVIMNYLMVDHNLAQENTEEIEYLHNFDFNANFSDSHESLDDDEREKADDRVDDSDENAVSSESPLRTIPLIISEDESEDSGQWNINVSEDFKGVFRSVINKIVKNSKAKRAIAGAPLKSGVTNDDIVSSNHAVARVLNTNHLSTSVSENATGNVTNSEIRRPNIVWRQNKYNISIKIQVVGAVNYEVKIEQRVLKFKANTNAINYGFQIELYGPVNRNECKDANMGQYILVKLVKVLNRTWLTLTRSGGIMKWITYDVDNIDISSDEESLDGKDLENIVKYIHYARDSDTDDEDLIDDVDLNI